MPLQVSCNEYAPYKAHQRLIEADFYEYDYELDMVWVKTRAKFQIGALKPNDIQVAGVRGEVSKLPDCPRKCSFVETYVDEFHLHKIPEEMDIRSPLEARSRKYLRNWAARDYCDRQNVIVYTLYLGFFPIWPRLDQALRL